MGEALQRCIFQLNNPTIGALGVRTEILLRDAPFDELFSRKNKKFGLETSIFRWGSVLIDRRNLRSAKQTERLQAQKNVNCAGFDCSILDVTVANSDPVVLH